MAQNNGMTNGLVLGLFVGGIVGAALALLYAPKTGKELRADIKEKADDLLEEAEGYKQLAKSKVSEIVSEAKQRSDQLISDAQKKADTLIEEADKALAGARQKAGVVMEEGKKVTNAVKAGRDAYKEERSRS
jgi:gas vesicle protein